MTTLTTEQRKTIQHCLDWLAIQPTDQPRHQQQTWFNTSEATMQKCVMFDQGHTDEAPDKYALPECGTSMCLAGYVAYLHENSTTIAHLAATGKDLTGETWRSTGMKHLGLQGHPDLAQQLFHEDINESDITEILDEALYHNTWSHPRVIGVACLAVDFVCNECGNSRRSETPVEQDGYLYCDEECASQDMLEDAQNCMKCDNPVQPWHLRCEGCGDNKPWDPPEPDTYFCTQCGMDDYESMEDAEMCCAAPAEEDT